MSRSCFTVWGCVRIGSLAAAAAFFVLWWISSNRLHWISLGVMAVWYIFATVQHVRALRWAGHVRPGEKCLVRHFAAVSMAWLGCVVCQPDVLRRLDALLVTFLLILVNFAVSVFLLFRYRRVSVWVVLLPLPLFCALNAQMYWAPCPSDVARYVIVRVYSGADEPCPRQTDSPFHVEPAADGAPPGWWDWAQFTAVQFLRAADLLDILELQLERRIRERSPQGLWERVREFAERVRDEFCRDCRTVRDSHGQQSTGSTVEGDYTELVLQRILPKSFEAKILTVFMHLNVDLFVGGAIYAALIGIARRRAKAMMLQRSRDGVGRPSNRLRRVGSLLRPRAAFTCLVLVGLAANLQHWPPAESVLWMIENILKPLDIGDFFQVFHVKFHHLPKNAANGMLAVMFRLLVASYVASLIVNLRLLVFGAHGLSVYELAAMLESPYTTVRRRAARSLSQIPDAEDALDVLPSLHEALNDPDPVVQATAVGTLARIGPEAFVPRLIEMIRDPNELIWRATGRCLTKMGPEAIAYLVRGLADGEHPVVIRSMDTLSEMAQHCQSSADRQAISEKLVGLLPNADTGISDAAGRCLGKMGSGALPYLQKALDDGKAVVVHVVECLGQIAQHDDATVPEIRALLNSLATKDPRVREAVETVMDVILQIEAGISPDGGESSDAETRFLVGLQSASC